MGARCDRGGACRPIVPRVRGVALPILSVVALALTFYPWRQEWLIWLAFVPLLAWLGDPGLTRRGRWIGLWVFGACSHFVLLAPFLSLSWWGWESATEQTIRTIAAYHRVFLSGLVVAISVWAGLAVGAVGSVMRRAIHRPLVSLWLVPSIWVFVIEYLGHGTVFGFSWGLIGNRLHAHEPLRQLASLTGVYGLSFLVLMVNAHIASWVLSACRAVSPLEVSRGVMGRRYCHQLLGATLILFVVLGASFGYSVATRRSANLPPSSQGLASRVVAGRQDLRVALLQGAKAQYTTQDFTAEGLDRLYGPMVDQAMAQGAALIVLPEAVWFRTLQLDGTASRWAHNPIRPAQIHKALERRRRTGHEVVIMGLDTVREGRMYNSTTFWTSAGLAGLYHKRRLVPFSEYRPAILGRLAPQSQLHGAGFTYTPGEGAQVVRLGSLVLGPFICQEVLFPTLIRQTARAGAHLLVTTGNDGVFRSAIVAQEQANLAKLRAIENGRYLLRCMKTGVSAIIDPTGRVLAQGGLNARSVVLAAVRPRSQLTWYTRLGDWVVWAAGLILVLIGLLSVLSRRRTRAGSGAKAG